MRGEGGGCYWWRACVCGDLWKRKEREEGRAGGRLLRWDGLFGGTGGLAFEIREECFEGEDGC